MDATGTTVEDRLVRTIQPLRHLALAHSLYALLDTGLHAALTDEPGLGTDRIAERLGLSPVRLDAFFHYLANEGYLQADGPGWSLTEQGHEVGVFRPWFQLLVGGYGQTFAGIGPALAAGAGWSGRNGAEVAVGACGMSRFDAIPLAHSLLGTVTGPDAQHPVTVVDVGCGDGSFLTELAERRPGLRGIGLEPDAEVTAIARKVIADAGLSERVEVATLSGMAAADVPVPATGAVCYLASFVLQELLEQQGEDAVVDLLTRTGADRPDTWWLVLEVDHVTDDARLTEGLGQAFYNPYFLLHAVTEQRLVDRATWRQLFNRAGLEVVALEHPDPAVDSTDLIIGFLARRTAAN